MAKVKISEFSSTAGNNTDIDGINLAEGMAPSLVNDAIRELMAQLKDFQTGAVGDSFNGPIGTSTAAAGAFTTLSASSTVSGTGFSTYLASPPAIGGTTAAAGAFTTLAASGAVTLSGGTANGVTYLNGSKVLTSGSALTFDGTNLGVGANITASASSAPSFTVGTGSGSPAITLYSATNLQSQISFADATTGSGAYDGYLLYDQNSQYMAFGIAATEKLRLTSTSLYTASGINVGIGTSTIPSGRRLIVESSGDTVARINSGGASSGLSFEFANNGTLRGGIGNGSGNITSGNAADMAIQANANLVFATGGYAQTMRLDSAGNLGLGVTPSAWSTGRTAFEITGSTQGNIAFNSGTPNNGGTISTNAYFNGNWYYKANGFASSLQTTSGGFNWQLAASGTAGNAISFTQAMSLTADGNLGVGTTSPVNLSGAGDLTAQRIFASQRSTTFPAIGFATDTNTGIDWPSADTLSFNTGGTERARIDSSGNLLVGTDNPVIDGGLGIKLLNDTNKHISAVSTSSTNAGGETFVMYSTTAGAYRFYVGWGGTVYATSTTITAISDQRLKENIRDLDDGLNVVMALKPRKFDWKEGKGQNIKNARGFIAQEFETVLPDMIEEWRDPAPEGEEAYKAINANLIPTLVKAIQELKAEFDAYKASHP